MNRAIDVIDSELRLVADIRQACREQGWPTPTTDRADELLDERVSAHPARQLPALE
jgi:hypothetical protein